MSPNWLTDAQVEAEIERLNKSPMVALARKEKRIRERRRQYLYNLRVLEKKGLAMAQEGLSLAMLEEMPVEPVREERSNIECLYSMLNLDNKALVVSMIEKMLIAQGVRK